MTMFDTPFIWKAMMAIMRVFISKKLRQKIRVSGWSLACVVCAKWVLGAIDREGPCLAVLLRITGVNSCPHVAAFPGQATRTC